jgi:hypothetical protein
MEEVVLTRKQLQEQLDAERVRNDAIMARLEALESSKGGTVDDLVKALREDRESAKSAALQKELNDAYAQIDHLKLPQTPTGPGIHYKGWVQAKEDSWDMTGYHFGPKEGKPGEVFQVDMPDYWPGCPFTPVIIKGTREDGLPITAPHPDFLSH